MEPETKLEAMTYLVSFTYYLLTHSLTHYLRLHFPPFSISIPISTSLFLFFFEKEIKKYLFTDLFNSFQIQYKIQPQAQSNKPPHIANNNAFLGDVVSTCRNTKFDDDAPISAGFYRQEKGMYDIYPCLSIKIT